MRNRKFLGKLPAEQTVRDKPKPFIIEMNEWVIIYLINYSNLLNIRDSSSTNER